MKTGPPSNPRREVELLVWALAPLALSYVSEAPELRGATTVLLDLEPRCRDPEKVAKACRGLREAMVKSGIHLRPDLLDHRTAVETMREAMGSSADAEQTVREIRALLDRRPPPSPVRGEKRAPPSTPTRVPSSTPLLFQLSSPLSTNGRYTSLLDVSRACRLLGIVRSCVYLERYGEDPRLVKNLYGVAAVGREWRKLPTPEAGTKFEALVNLSYDEDGDQIPGTTP
ncbi:hypothetical protein CMI37_18935 [Candidatus Pacearchaeota archaeon]|nr:hypothetical protein [Candidatus Pacearchaeota archaeon]